MNLPALVEMCGLASLAERSLRSHPTYTPSTCLRTTCARAWWAMVHRAVLDTTEATECAQAYLRTKGRWLPSCLLSSKEWTCNAGDEGLILGWEDPLRKEMVAHPGILMLGRSQSMGSQKSGDNYFFKQQWQQGGKIDRTWIVGFRMRARKSKLSPGFPGAVGI